MIIIKKYYLYINFNIKSLIFNKYKNYSYIYNIEYINGY